LIIFVANVAKLYTTIYLIILKNYCAILIADFTHLLCNGISEVGLQSHLLVLILMTT